MSVVESFDVFLSHSSRDKTVVRNVAEHLKNSGLKVWFDEWIIQPGDSIPAKVEEGLERSRVLVLCMSAQAFGSDWALLESYTFRFRDPLNHQRRFIPLRLDDAPIKGSLAQFLYIDLVTDQDVAIQKLVSACRPPVVPTGSSLFVKHVLEPQGDKVFGLGHAEGVWSVAFSPDGRHALSGAGDRTVRIWDAQTGHALRVLEGHTDYVRSVTFSPDGRFVLSGSEDQTIRLWDTQTGQSLRVFRGHADKVHSVAFSPDGCWVLSGSDDDTMRLWEAQTGHELRVFEGHTQYVRSVAFSPDGRFVLSGSDDATLQLWDVHTGEALHTFNGHADRVRSVAFSPNGRFVLSGSCDGTLRLWDTRTGRAVHVFEGHSDYVVSVAFSSDGHFALSGSDDYSLRLWDTQTGQTLRVFEGHRNRVRSVAFSPDGRFALSGAHNNTLRLWDVQTGQALRVFEGHTDYVQCLAFSPDGRFALSGAHNNTLQLWDVQTGQALRVFEEPTDYVQCLAFSPDGRYALSGSFRSMCLWSVETGRPLRVFNSYDENVQCVALSPDMLSALSGSADSKLWLSSTQTGQKLRVFEGHTDSSPCVIFSPDGRLVLSGSDAGTLRLWDAQTGKFLRVFEGHASRVRSVAFSPDGRLVLSGSEDETLRLWDAQTGQALRVFEGHASRVWSVAFSPDGRLVLSGSYDGTLRLWDAQTGLALRAFEGHLSCVICVGFSPDGRSIYSAAQNNVLRIWPLAHESSTDVTRGDALQTMRNVQYANAKVLLVGDSGVGKSGLANYLARGIKVEENKPLLSTDGAWATQWTIPHEALRDRVDREIWLWDFAGQVDYRLVHQIFMDDTAAAVLVFNPQTENPFDGLGQWDKDLQRRATHKPFAKLLTAGRVDRGGLVVSDAAIQRFTEERGFVTPLHMTSAKTGEGCDALRDAIVASIDWERIPITTSMVLYQRMKREILALRDQGMVLIRLAELNQRLELLLPDQPFTFDEMNTAIRHLAAPGIIQRLDFGGFVLLQPEVLSRYAAALVRAVRKHPEELGCISEAELRTGDLDYQDFERLPSDDEAVVLKALHELVVRNGWCLQQASDQGDVLVFPSYFRRERPVAPDRPSVLVSYRFAGPVDDVYATLVVRLHHTTAFESTDLWKDAADFRTQEDARLGLNLTREGEGKSRLDAYFMPEVDQNSRVLFLRYVDQHLRAHAHEVTRLRHYFCGNKKCNRFNQSFFDRASIDEALTEGGSGKVYCPSCGKPILLCDSLERKFDAPAASVKVLKLVHEGQFAIDNESRELQAVHHTGLIVAEAGQIYRSITNSDHGIDGEIEFKDDQGQATGARLYVQIKSGDSYLRQRERDRAEVFQIKNARWAKYWQQHAYPVMLVIRASDGEIRWMDVSAYLKQEAARGESVKQVVFKGERLDVMSVRRWREVLLRTQPLTRAPR